MAELLFPDSVVRAAAEGRAAIPSWVEVAMAVLAVLAGLLVEMGKVAPTTLQQEVPVAVVAGIGLLAALVPRLALMRPVMVEELEAGVAVATQMAVHLVLHIQALPLWQAQTAAQSDLVY